MIYCDVIYKVQPNLINSKFNIDTVGIKSIFNGVIFILFQVTLKSSLTLISSIASPNWRITIPNNK